MVSAGLAVLGAAALVGVLAGLLVGPRGGLRAALAALVLGVVLAVIVRVRTGGRPPAGGTDGADPDDLAMEVTLAPPLRRLVPRDVMEPPERR